jgi:hypothetical protein
MFGDFVDRIYPIELEIKNHEHSVLIATQVVSSNPVHGEACQ